MFDPLIAAAVPDNCAAGKLVKFAPEPENDDAVTTPVTFNPPVTIISLKVESLAVLIPVGRLVKFAPLIAGSAPVKLPAGIEVRFAAKAAGSVAGNLAYGIVPEPRLLAFNEV